MTVEEWLFGVLIYAIGAWQVYYDGVSKGVKSAFDRLMIIFAVASFWYGGITWILFDLIGLFGG